MWAMEAKLLFESDRIGRHQNRSAARMTNDMAPRIKVQDFHAGSASAVEMDHRLRNIDELNSSWYGNSTSIFVHGATVHQGLRHTSSPKEKS
jgi:hypothetical protein